MSITDKMNLVTKPDRSKELTINDTICWICGKKFNYSSIKDRKTNHHAIPKIFKPKKNIKVPICQECHYQMNKFYITHVPKNLKAVANFISHMKLFISKYERKLESYNKSSVNLKHQENAPVVPS